MWMVLIAAAALTPAPASAPDRDGARTSVVRHHDLDLARDDHQAKLKRRIGHAIGRMCQPRGRTVAEQIAAIECRKVATVSGDRGYADAVLAQRAGRERLAQLGAARVR